jgi:hypothetical protein
MKGFKPDNLFIQVDYIWEKFKERVTHEGFNEGNKMGAGGWVQDMLNKDAA